MNCPKCGAKPNDTTKLIDWACGSVKSETRVYESRDCVTRQRDQLESERDRLRQLVSELTEQRDDARNRCEQAWADSKTSRKQRDYYRAKSRGLPDVASDLSEYKPQ